MPLAASYSPVEHLAKICLPTELWAGVHLAMMTAAFDASGHESDQPFLVVAGFISSATDWLEFERRWQDRLAQSGISHFHATHCENNYGEFLGWSDRKEEKTKLKRELLDIIHGCTYQKFGCAVEIATYQTSLSQENRAEYGLNAYVLAGRTVAARVRQWALVGNFRNIPELVFEQGDVGEDKLRKRLIDDGFAEPHFRPKKESLTKDGFIKAAHVPLQAADFLAYEIFQAHKRMNLDRWEIRDLLNKVGPIGTYTVKNLEELNERVSMRAEELRTYEHEGVNLEPHSL